MTEKMPRAIFLATMLPNFPQSYADESAVELRRLHEVEQEARFSYMEGYECAKDEYRDRIAALEKALGMAVEALECLVEPDRAKLRRAALATAKQTLNI